MWSSWRWMPDSNDSGGYGTRMRSDRFRPTGGGAPAPAAAYCQVPLSVRHRSRTSCGRGYSGRAFVGETSLAHGVVIWYVDVFTA